VEQGQRAKGETPNSESVREQAFNAQHPTPNDGKRHKRRTRLRQGYGAACNEHRIRLPRRSFGEGSGLNK
jgi:hypothetical protein